MKNLLSLALPALIFISCGQNPPETIEAEVATSDTSVYTPEWSKDATIYEVNIRQHTPEGTFAAFTEDIARINEARIGQEDPQIEEDTSRLALPNAQDA